MDSTPDRGTARRSGRSVPPRVASATRKVRDAPGGRGPRPCRRSRMLDRHACYPFMILGTRHRSCAVPAAMRRLTDRQARPMPPRQQAMIKRNRSTAVLTSTGRRNARVLPALAAITDGPPSRATVVCQSSLRSQSCVMPCWTHKTIPVVEGYVGAYAPSPG